MTEPEEPEKDLDVDDIDGEFMKSLKAVYGDKIPAGKVVGFIVEQMNLQIALWQKKCFECVVPPSVRKRIKRKLQRFDGLAETEKLGWKPEWMVEKVEKVGAKPLLIIPGAKEPLMAGMQTRTMDWAKPGEGSRIASMQIEVSSHNPIVITFDFPDTVFWTPHCATCGGWVTIEVQPGNLPAWVDDYTRNAVNELGKPVRLKCPDCKDGRP